MTEDPTPTVDVVGGWTSARLLIRILHTIDSPWTLSSAGLTHRVSGETCVLEMRGPDPDFVDRIRQGESPVMPSLTEANLEGLDDHRSVVRLEATAELRGEAACRAVLRCGAALVDAGAVALHCVQSGLSHGGEHWQGLARMADAAAEAEEADHLGEALYLAVVHPLQRWPDGFRTAGMGLLGHADAAIDAEVPDAVALDVMEAVHRRALSGRPLAEGDRVRTGPARPAFVLSRTVDPVDASMPHHNPFGLWRLAPQTG